LTAVERLVTFVDINDARDRGPDAETMSVQAHHVALLDDGREVLLIGDRGWTSRIPAGLSRDHESIRDLRDTAMKAVWEAGQPEHVAAVLRTEGVAIDPDAVHRIPHEIEISDRVIARVPQRPDIRRVYLMTDHHASSLWHGDHHFGVEPESLGLSARTCCELWAWSDIEVRNFNAWMNGEPEPCSDEKYVAEGFRLWRLARAELFGRCDVGFAFFDEYGKRIEWDPDAPSAQWRPD
jgi:hypothetical protein